MIDEFEIKLNWLIIRKHYYDVTILISGTECNYTHLYRESYQS